jgi:hypothetical protein
LHLLVDMQIRTTRRGFGLAALLALARWPLGGKLRLWTLAGMVAVAPVLAACAGEAPSADTQTSAADEAAPAGANDETASTEDGEVFSSASALHADLRCGHKKQACPLCGAAPRPGHTCQTFRCYPKSQPCPAVP